MHKHFCFLHSVTKVKVKCNLCEDVCIERNKAGLSLHQKHERNLLQSGVKSSVENPKIGTDAFQTF